MNRTMHNTILTIFVKIFFGLVFTLNKKVSANKTMSTAKMINDHFKGNKGVLKKVIKKRIPAMTEITQRKW